MRWHVRRITVLQPDFSADFPAQAACQPYRLVGIRRNEIQGKIPTRAVAGWIMDPSSAEPYLVDSAGREGVAHLRMWLTAGPEPGHLAVVTHTRSAAAVTEFAGQVWAELARRYGLWLVLLEHHPAPEAREGAETLDLVRVGADGSPHWLRVWPTVEENPRHAGLELWMAVHGHRIVSKPASWFDSCERQEG